MAEAVKRDAAESPRLKRDQWDKPLTYVNALNIQQEHLDQWASILSISAMVQLRNHAEIDNEQVLASRCSTPYDIFRGQMIYEWLSNNLMRKS